MRTRHGGTTPPPIAYSATGPQERGVESTAASRRSTLDSVDLEIAFIGTTSSWKRTLGIGMLAWCITFVVQMVLKDTITIPWLLGSWLVLIGIGGILWRRPFDGFLVVVLILALPGAIIISRHVTGVERVMCIVFVPVALIVGFLCNFISYRCIRLPRAHKAYLEGDKARMSLNAYRTNERTEGIRGEKTPKPRLYRFPRD
ncbi:MAG: hypothetical protein HN964_03440 [Candidatus Jacksonbacteria bacterium]|jgi:hypothetical protein|nr:hypothetical protein [Candidatus Jacksonbacteria bacterium]